MLKYGYNMNIYGSLISARKFLGIKNRLQNYLMNFL